jgi:hypothetical protein
LQEIPVSQVGMFPKTKASLILDGLAMLSPQFGEQLLNYRGRELHLSGLKRLDDDSAMLLSVTTAGKLYLNGLDSLSKAHAEWLVKYKGKGVTKDTIFDGEIYLDGLKDLKPEVANALAAFHGTILSLSGLKTIDDVTLAELNKFSGKQLLLYGLDTLNAAGVNIIKANSKLMLRNEVAQSMGCH